MFDDTLTDPELAAALRDTQAESLQRVERDGPHDDTLNRVLSPEERAKLSMDSWEPSLLRYLLDAEGRLERGSKS